MSLVFCNRYTSPVSVAIMRYDPQSCPNGDRFSVQGWWNIPPNVCTTVYGGSVGYNRYWAFYAESADGRTWTGDVRAWVSNNAFKLCHSDSCSPCRVVGFRQFDVNSYDNYTINLVA